MGCANGKQINIKKFTIQNKQSQNINSSREQSQTSINDCETIDHSVNRICVLEQCCVAIKIQLNKEYNLETEKFNQNNLKSKVYEQIQDRADVLKLLINLADEIQESSYQIFDKDLKDEPKLEEYLISLIWACQKLKLIYIEKFLLNISPFFHSDELNLNKVNINVKELINKIK